MTRIPNVPERVKEAPAHALRAVFAGIGQALLLSDRMRRKLKSPDEDDNAGRAVAGIPVRKPTAVKPAAKVTVAPTAKAATVASATKLATTTPATVGARPAAEAPTAAPAAEAPAPAGAKHAATVPVPAIQPATQSATQSAAQPVTQPPIPNYDELSVASLRARLRGLDLDQVRLLLSYEKSRGSRSEVITMYERRIVKLGEADG